MTSGLELAEILAREAAVGPHDVNRESQVHAQTFQGHALLIAIAPEQQANDVVLHRRERPAGAHLVAELAMGKAPFSQQLGDVSHRGGKIHR